MQPCARALLRRLAHHGGWMGRDELEDGLGFGATVVDDALADLVAAGDALFNTRGREYRLGGTQLARRAARDLLRNGVERAAVMAHDRNKRLCRVGLARRVTLGDGEPHLVMAEIEMDYPGLDGVLAVASLIDRWAR